MPRYTLVVDFAGGTYVGQVQAASPSEAPTTWAHRLRSEGIPGVGAADLTAIAEGLSGSEPVEVRGLNNVWCISATVDERLVLAHIVHSAE